MLSSTEPCFVNIPNVSRFWQHSIQRVDREKKVTWRSRLLGRRCLLARILMRSSSSSSSSSSSIRSSSTSWTSWSPSTPRWWLALSSSCALGPRGVAIGRVLALARASTTLAPHNRIQLKITPRRFFFRGRFTVRGPPNHGRKRLSYYFT